MKDTSSIRRTLNHLIEWLFHRLSPTDKTSTKGARASKKYSLMFVGLCLLIFIVAFGVRFFQWQDNPATIGESLSSLVNRYQTQAEGILEDGGILFPAAAPETVGIQRLVHPPGYPILIATVYRIFGQSNAALTWVHLCFNALSAVLLFMIAAELVPQAIAFIAGMLAAISPHLAAHSPVLLPDSLVALPILTAVYLLVRARHKPHYVAIIFAGALIGFSCWLRSNAMLLAPFLGVLIFCTFERSRRWRYATVFVFVAILAIAPVTIRNWVLYDRFIPLSLGAGITLVEGIADYDYDKRFDMPASDEEGKSKDVKWHNRPDYETGLWRPDGIERDRYRFSRGFAVIRANPLWFISVMARRAASMLRYNDNLQQGWPADTSGAPLVLATVPFGEDIEPADDKPPVWSATPKELLTNGQLLSSEASVSLVFDEQMLEIIGDASNYGEQFSSATIPVDKNSNYVLKIQTRLKQAPVAILATSADRKIMLGRFLPNQDEAGEDSKKTPDKSQKVEDTNAGQKETLNRIQGDFNADELNKYVGKILFASGNRNEVRLIVINNGGAQPAVGLGDAELFEVGKTPFLWTQPFRLLIRQLQKVIFRTAVMVPLIFTGLLLLWLARQKLALIILLAVPLYYMCVQSAFHTEYRYVLPIHYFLFVLAATTFYCAGVAITQAGYYLKNRLWQRKTEPSGYQV
jgi:hypothetical protein